MTILPTVMWVPLNEGTFVSGGSSFAKGSAMAISPHPILREQCRGHRLGDGADFECCALIDRAIRFRISAEIGLGRGAVFDDGCSDAGAGPVALEALHERGTQIVFAGCQ